MKNVVVSTLSILVLAGSLNSHPRTEEAQKRAQRVKAENQPIADLGNGFYQNPIMGGDYADPTIVRVGEDYYMAFTRRTGIMLWHSRDLVNWRPIIRHTLDDLDGILATDLAYFNGKFHSYMPAGSWPGKAEERYPPNRANFVITAEKPEGPWSEPIRVDRDPIEDDLYVGNDPGFIQTPEGKKYLHTDVGFVMPLSDDGLRVTAPAELVYDGWEYPKDWIVEAKGLESPKLFFKSGFYYMVTAMGGTGGPSTAHMAVVARSESPTGPWTDSPHNPLVHTYSASEKWWRQGHATVLEAADGSWWTVYHATSGEGGGLGRQTLLMPVAWTSDGWPVIKNGLKSWDTIPMPKGENVGHGMPLSDDFSSDELGIQWVYNPSEKERVLLRNGELLLEARGASSKNASSIWVVATNESFEATVKIECPEGVLAGLTFGNHEGLKTDGEIVGYTKGDMSSASYAMRSVAWGGRSTDVPLKTQGSVYLKIRNDRGDISFYSSDDGEHWTTFQNGGRSSDHTIRLFAARADDRSSRKVKRASFSQFKYIGLESPDTTPMREGDTAGHGMPISDDFSSDELGIQWVPSEKERVLIRNGELLLEARGENSKNASYISAVATYKSFEATVKIECPEGVLAGLTFGNHEGLKTDGEIVSYTKGDRSSVYHAMRSVAWGGRSTDVPLKTQGSVYLKIRNDRGDLSFYSSEDGEHWTTFQNGIRSSDHTIRLFAARADDRSTRKVKRASFSQFKYIGLE